MKRISRCVLLASFVCLFLLSCGSSHKSVKTVTEADRKDSISESVSILHGSATSLTDFITTEGRYVIDFRIYDTRKPPDSLTGKPPILADGQITGDFNKNENKEALINDCMEVKADKEIASTEHEETKTEEVKEKKESTFVEQIAWACAGITVLVVVVLVVRQFRY